MDVQVRLPPFVVPRAKSASAQVVQNKMATFTGAEVTQRVFRFQEAKYTTSFRRTFRTHCGRERPSRQSICSWRSHFV